MIKTKQIEQTKRPVKTEGYAHAPFGAARREVRRADAKARKVKYDALSLEEKLRRATRAPGQSRKQTNRLLKIKTQQAP